MLTPVANPQMAYNNAHASARNCIERTNGIIKRRFSALKYGMRLHINNTQAVIVATVVLHNIAVTVGDDEPREGEELAQYMAQRRQEMLDVDYNVQEVQSPAAAMYPGASGMRQTLINNYF